MKLSWSDFIARISLRPSFPLRLAVEQSGETTFLLAMLDAPDIHTGNQQTVHLRWPAPNLADAQPHYALRLAFDFVRQLLKATLEHELDECLLLDGIQVRDPHKER